MKVFRTLSIALILFLFLAACSPAAKTTYQTVSEGTLKPGNTVPVPHGDVVLTMDGKISQSNAGNTLQFDMATLESIGVVQYKVDDPFAKKTILYAGVLLSQLLKVAGASSDATSLTLWALDDYSTDMKISDANRWPILIATRADGAHMPTDQNGPLISVFPFNDFPEIDHLTYDAQWLWALAKITVK
ncbi:MAG TPA: molybdopterin-dependent oxidoreductase [Anaerolineales bacterium]|nr:molybdopterin-dependent oxidoreductase [Anaerolineales bacterium]